MSIDCPATMTFTPKLLAEAWISMDSGEQAEFFAALHDAIPMSKLEMQSVYIRKACEKLGPKALEAAMTFTGIIFKHGFLDDPAEKWMIDTYDAERWIAGLKVSP